MMIEHDAARFDRDNPASLDNEIHLFHRFDVHPRSSGGASEGMGRPGIMPDLIAQ